MVVDIVQELKRDNPNLVYGRYRRTNRSFNVKVSVMERSQTLLSGFGYSAPVWQSCIYILYF